MTAGSKALALTLIVVLTACGDSDPVAPSAADAGSIAFTPSVVDLDDQRSATVTLRNTGSVDVGPIEMIASSVVTSSGVFVPGAMLTPSVAEIPTLPAGGSREVVLSVTMPDGADEGLYRTGLDARNDDVMASVAVDLRVEVLSPIFPVGSVEITSGPQALRQGEVGAYTVEVREPNGDVSQAPVAWSVDPPPAGFVADDGRFVGYQAGTVSLIADVSGTADTTVVQVSPRGAPSGSFAETGAGLVSERYTSDHWEHGPAAYSGTWGCRDSICGNELFVWNISGATPVRVDSVEIDARTANDVKVRADGALAIVTHEVSNDGRNGITILDLTDPLKPTKIARFTDPELSPGVHNVWIEGDYAYLVVDGTSAASGLKVIDISNPSNPAIVGRFYAGSSFLHDVYVRDGLAFLSHWNAGLVILDVGNGVAGGSPANPREVSRFVLPGYRVHNAWYWPESGYVFLGDEIGIPGRMIVVDVNDLAAPARAATLTIDGAAPHNFWLDETRGIGYFAWYEQGLQAVDVSGELLGQLELQGRRIAEAVYGPSTGCVQQQGQGTCTWAPQLHDGKVYVSDMNTGLRVFQPTF